MVSVLEKEVLGRADITDEVEVCRHTGRAFPPSFIEVPVLPQKSFNTSGQRGLTFHLKSLALAADDVLHALRKVLIPAEWARGPRNPWSRQQQAANRLRKRVKGSQNRHHIGNARR